MVSVLGSTGAERRLAHRRLAAPAVLLVLLLHAALIQLWFGREQVARLHLIPPPPVFVELQPDAPRRSPPPAPTSVAPAAGGGGGGAESPRSIAARAPLDRSNLPVTPAVEPLPVVTVAPLAPVALDTLAEPVLVPGVAGAGPDGGLGAGRGGGSGEGRGAGSGAGSGGGSGPGVPLLSPSVQLADPVWRPAWIHMPGPAEVGRFHPRDGSGHPLPGWALLRCTITPFGRAVRCSVIDESAPRFGRAALSASPLFRITSRVVGDEPVAAPLDIRYEFRR